MTNTYINYDKLFNPFLIKPNLKKQNTRFFGISIFYRTRSLGTGDMNKKP